MFIVLSLSFSLLGFLFLSKPRTVLLLFFFLAAMIPSSSAFEKMVSNFGIYFYEPFIFIVAIIYLIKKPRSIFRGELSAQLLVVLLLFIYLVFGAVIYGVDKYLLREVRLILCIALPLLMMPAINKIKITEREISKIVIVASVFHVIAFFMFQNSSVLVSNVYYSEENSYRYSGFATYLCAAFMLYAATNKEKFTSKLLFNIAGILSVAVILIAGSRIMILGLVLSLIFASTKSVRHFAYAVGMGFVMSLAFFYIVQYLNVDRLNSLFDVDALIGQSLIRLSPAMEYFESAGIVQTILGHGLGATFDIPWFEYQNLDTKHNTIDSAYPTLWVKIGAFSVLYIYALIKMAAFNQGGTTRRAIYMFLLIMMLTTSLPYQPLFSVFTLFMLLLSRVVYVKVEPSHEN